MKLFLLFCAQCISISSAYLNLYLARPEVQRLLGLDAELYYVREGVINEYALNFTVTVPANYSRLFFTWNSLIKKPMPYLAQIEYNNGEAMAIPFLNISSKGFVPKKATTFSLSLPCSGASDGEVKVNLHLNISSSSKSRVNVTKLTIRRLKICLKGVLAEDDLPRNESIHLNPDWSNPPMATLYVAVGIATTATIMIITVASVIYLRIKRHRDQLNCRYYNGPGFLGAGNGSAYTTNRMISPSIRSNSYATIASLKKFPMASPNHQLLTSSNVPPNYGGSVHYASSPLSQLFSQVQSSTCSPTHSLLNTGLSQSSWRGPNSAKSFKSWRDPRQIDPTERIRQLTVDRWRVIVGEVMHQGTFGRIHQGLCHDPYTQNALSVVVKTVSGQASSTQAKLLLREGLLLANLHHPHLLPVLGVCSQDPAMPLLIYSFQGLKNLKLSLRGKNTCDGSVDNMKLLTRDAVKVGIGISNGLSYLHQQRILHKDIATRNTMIDMDLQAKLTDTALSRDLFPEDYHCLGDNENRPIKWMSLESIAQKQFTPATDVWMYGVLLWELVTSAQQPYTEIDAYEMCEYLRDGYRLSQPHSCPDDLFAVMASCWSPFPEDRPNVKTISNCLSELHMTLSSFI